MSDRPPAASDRTATGASSDHPDRAAAGDASADAGDHDPEALAAQLAVLEAENERLREAYRDAHRTRYRRTALALAAVGVLALAGGVAAGNEAVLLALGGTGVFAGILTYFLTPEQFITADVGRRVYEALAGNVADVAAALALTDDRIYVPTGGGVRLFVPRTGPDDLPADRDALDEPFVVAGDEARGLSLAPTGGPLLDDLDRARTGTEADVTPRAAARTLADALVEQFELLDVADVEDAGEGRITVGVAGSVYGPLDAFDHPVASVLGTGLARHLDAPVTVEAAGTDDDRYDAVVACSWSDPASADASTDA